MNIFSTVSGNGVFHHKKFFFFFEYVNRTPIGIWQSTKFEESGLNDSVILALLGYVKTICIAPYCRLGQQRGEILWQVYSWLVSVSGSGSKQKCDCTRLALPRVDIRHGTVLFGFAFVIFARWWADSLLCLGLAVVVSKLRPFSDIFKFRV